MTAGRTVNSISQNWCTPPKFVNAVYEVFGERPELDPCSNKDSIVKAKINYILPKNDGLIEDWKYKTIYINPPYGADRMRGTTIKNWLRKCYEANKLYDSQVLALIPVASNTIHWKHYIWGKATGICFLYDTRLKFLIDGTTKNKGAPMACAMIYWGNNYNRFFQVFVKYGAVVNIGSLNEVKIGAFKNTSQDNLL